MGRRQAPRSKNGQFTKKGTGTSGASASKKKTKSGPKDFLKKLDSISNTKNLSDKDKSVINSIFEKGKEKSSKPIVTGVLERMRRYKDSLEKTGAKATRGETDTKVDSAVNSGAISDSFAKRLLQTQDEYTLKKINKINMSELRGLSNAYDLNQRAIRESRASESVKKAANEIFNNALKEATKDVIYSASHLKEWPDSSREEINAYVDAINSVRRYTTKALLGKGVVTDKKQGSYMRHKKGKPMSHEEAAKNINDWNPEVENGATCVAVYEARRKGYNVKASHNAKYIKSGEIFPTLFYIDRSTGLPPEPSVTEEEASWYIDGAFEEMKVGERHLLYSKQGSGDTRSYCLMKTGDSPGKGLVLFDPRTNETAIGTGKISNYLNPTGKQENKTVFMRTRIDNCDLNSEFVDGPKVIKRK